MHFIKSHFLFLCSASDHLFISFFSHILIIIIIWSHFGLFSLPIKCSRSTSALINAYFGPSGRVLKLRAIRTFFHSSSFFVCYRLFRFSHFAGNNIHAVDHGVDDKRHLPLCFNPFFSFLCATSFSFSLIFFFCIFFFFFHFFALNFWPVTISMHAICHTSHNSLNFVFWYFIR